MNRDTCELAVNTIDVEKLTAIAMVFNTQARNALGEGFFAPIKGRVSVADIDIITNIMHPHLDRTDIDPIRLADQITAISLRSGLEPAQLKKLVEGTDACGLDEDYARRAAPQLSQLIFA